MTVHWIDWTLVIAYFVFVTAIGLRYRDKAGSSMVDFFVSGRSLPWWLAGTSMVATSFASDTPLAVTGLVARNGIAGNWLWWNFVMSGMLTVFFYARLWRRVGVLTDVEFTEVRYAGTPAAVLRAFRALYLAIPINCIVIGWVTLAMAKILGICLGVDRWVAVGICVAVTVLYSTMSGLWGVVITDFVQFGLAMGGTIALALLALHEVGGMSGLTQKLAALYGAQHSLLDFFPRVGSPWMPMSAFLVYIGVQWWAAWYPGAEPGGGGSVAQRMLSTRDEKHALLATLWFNVAHYALRPWPWIIVALVSMVLFPGLADKEAGYVHVMVRVLPVGFRGLLLVAFAAAFMSTISTAINWGASYIVNDFYRRFLKPEASERHYVLVSRLATVLMMVIAAVITGFMDTISGAWRVLLALGAGTGGVYILRWFWWRINAWSEISAMIASLAAALVLQLGFGLSADQPRDFAVLMLVTVACSTVVWVTVTLLTPPVEEKTLVAFYQKARPGGPLWGPIRRKLGNPSPAERLWRDFLDWLAGCALVYTALFGIGKLVLGHTTVGLLLVAASIGAAVLLYWDLQRRGFAAVAR
ncbi:MAG: Na+:solute symporter [Calditrichaeota bacterium]|nr:Na+:solute symporter [Calditrichota bacterium]